MGKGITQLAQGRESPLHRGVDQAKTASEGDLGAKRTQRPIRQEKAITTVECRGHQGLKQVLKSGIDPGHPNQYRTTPALLKHLQGNGAGGGSWNRLRAFKHQSMKGITQARSIT
jgi:hypothetical protein